jgi:hypothetical protein
MDQLRIERQVLRRRQRKLSGFDDDQYGLSAAIGVGGIVAARRTYRQRPTPRFAGKGSIGDAAFEACLIGHVEVDMVAPRRRADVHAAFPARADHRYASFARRGAPH